MTDIQTNVGTALYNRLTTFSAGTALWSNRVYNGQAPAGVILPYLIFYAISGTGDENNTPVRTFDLRYHIEAIAISHSVAQICAGHVDGALHHKDSNLSVSGQTVFWVVNTGIFEAIE